MARDMATTEVPHATQTASQLPYDHVDPGEIRQLRSEYRSLLSGQAEIRANISAVEVQDLKNNLDLVTQLFGGVKRAQEAALDSRAVTNLSEMTSLKARTMKHSVGGFDIDDFLARLVTFMSPGAGDIGGDENDNEETAMLDWEKLSHLALRKSRRVPGVSFMLGPLAKEAKKREVRRAKNRLNKNDTDRVVVEEVDPKKQAEQAEQSTGRMVNDMYDILCREGDVNYFRFLVNPLSFEQSVENIFHFAFLIKEGLAGLRIENGVPIAYSKDRASQDEYANGLRRRQNVIEFDMDTWKRAIEVFEIEDSIIPHRRPLTLSEKFPNYKGNGRGRTEIAQDDSDASDHGDHDPAEGEDEEED